MTIDPEVQEANDENQKMGTVGNQFHLKSPGFGIGIPLGLVAGLFNLREMDIFELKSSKISAFLSMFP